MSSYSGLLQFYSPQSQHALDVQNIVLAAQSEGLRVQVVVQEHFRNWQRFGARSVRSTLRISGDKGKPESFMSRLRIG